MNNITNDIVTGSNIYISDKSESEIRYIPLEITDGNTPINTLSHPFHLSTSNLYRNPSGFTGRSRGEVISYSEITHLTDFRASVQKDVAPSLFEENQRGKGRLIVSDVLIFDIDNHDSKNGTLFDDESRHLTIEKFTEIFKDYEFLIATSLNHQKQKGDQFKRDKYHCFLSLGQKVTDEDECNDLLDKLDYFIKSKTHDYESVEMGSDDDYSLIDTSVKSTYQIWGNEHTVVYYNKGGTINDLLYEETFSNDYTRYKRDSGKQRNSRYKENPTFSGNYELHKGDLLEDWDYVNIISRVGLHEFYKIDRSVGDGYFMGYCDLHNDNKTSLQIFPNGGYNCLACKDKGVSVFDYESKKTGTKSSLIRKRYCKELGLDHNHFIKYFTDKKKRAGDDMNSEWQDQVDEPDPNDSPDQLMIQIKELQKRLSEKTDEPVSEDSNEEEEPYQFPTKENDIFVTAEVYEELEELNKIQAVVNFEGKTVCPQYKPSRSDWNELEFPRKIVDMMTYYENNERKYRTFGNKGERVIKKMSLGKLWRFWDQRRKYNIIDFYPDDKKRNPRLVNEKEVFDMYDDWESADLQNDWRGDMSKRGLIKFLNQDYLNIITPDKKLRDLHSGCNLYLDHIYEIICGNYTGNKKKDLYNYIVGWMSKALTHHTEGRIGVAICMRGGQGTGKGTVQKVFGNLFGRHYITVDIDRFTARFNIELLDKLFVFIDESLFQGDKKLEQKLNIFVTEDSFSVEGKYINSFKAKNYQHYMFASNEQWVVPLSWDGRRYMIIDISDKYAGGKGRDEYFTPLYNQMNQGGREHLFKYLTHPTIMKIADEIDYQVDRPVTLASVETKFEGDPIGRWFYEILKSGGHYYTDDATDQTEFKEWDEYNGNNFYKDYRGLHESYLNFMNEEYPQELVSTGIGKLTEGLNKLQQQGLISFRSVSCDRKKHEVSWSYRFGSLNELKKLFVDRVFDGDEIMAWDEESFPEEDDTAPSEQKEMFDMFKKSNDLLKQKFGKSETEDTLDRGLDKMSDEFTEDLFFEDI